MSNEYYNLSITYYIENYLLATRRFWLNSVAKIEGIKYNLGAYLQNPDFIGLVLKNVLSIYEKGEMVNVYGFDF